MTHTRTYVLTVVFVGVVLLLTSSGTVAAQTAPDCSTVSYNGDGTEANPYEVGNVEQLQCIEEQDLEANYTQVADVDASDTSSWNGGDGFEPIGDSDPATPVTPFTGTYDGQRFNITDLNIDRDEPSVGLFGFVVDGGEVTNASVVNADITGPSGVGGIVAANGGTISESFVSGSIGDTDSAAAGGLVGENGVEGTINESYSTASIEGAGAVGGLAGGNEGTVEKSYARGSVDGDTTVAGLVGGNGGTIEESYATGPVSVAALPGGGLVAVSPGTVSDSYWDTQATGQSTSPGGTGLTTSEMTGTAATNNMQGFDFTSTWETVSGDYPILAWQTEGGSAPPNFEVSIDSTNSPVTEGETLDITGAIENTGDESDTQTITATASGLGSITRTVTLNAGESTTETVSVPTSPGDAGTYTVTVESEDDTATTTVTIEPDDGGGEGNATVESSDLRVDSTGETGESAITVDAENGLSIARLNVSVDTSVAEIRNVESGADVDPSQPAQTFDVIDQTADSVRIEYSNLQASSPVQDFEVARIELEAQTDDGETPIQILTDELRDGNTDSYDTVNENEGTFSVGAALFEEPLPGFNNPPQNTGELDPNLFEDIDGDGDGTDPTQAVTLWTELVLNPQDFDDLTQEQIDALDWNGDGQLTPADAVNLWTEQVLA